MHMRIHIHIYIMDLHPTLGITCVASSLQPPHSTFTRLRRADISLGAVTFCIASGAVAASLCATRAQASGHPAYPAVRWTTRCIAFLVVVRGAGLVGHPLLD